MPTPTTHTTSETIADQSMPGWVMVFGIVALVVVVLFVVLLVTGGHGPRRHTLAG